MRKSNGMNSFQKFLLIFCAVILTILIATVIVTFIIAERHGLTFVEQWKEWIEAIKVWFNSFKSVKG